MDGANAPPQRDRGGGARLTDLDLEVLRAVASDKEPLLDFVAKDLDIHRCTLGNHIKALCGKLQVKTVRGFVRVAEREGFC